MSQLTIGFDVYGTLVDPLQISQHLNILIGKKSTQFATVWRQKQLEYTFRRGLMHTYENFDVCTQQAMEFTIKYLDVDITPDNKKQLLALYTKLKPFDDVVPALNKIQQDNCTLVAFSNGVESTLRSLLLKTGLIDYFDDIVSVDEIKTFKPDPKVYAYLASRTSTDSDRCWVISGNSFDIIGAKSAGMNAAWIQRNAQNLFDPWEFSADIVAKDLLSFYTTLVNQQT